MLHHPAFDSAPYCGAKITPPPPLSLRPPFHEQHAGCGQDDSSPLDGRRPHLAGGQIPAQHNGDMDDGGEHERRPQGTPAIAHQQGEYDQADQPVGQTYRPPQGVILLRAFRE